MTDLGIVQLSVPTPFPIGPVNLYLVEGKVVTLIDAGPKTEEAYRTLEQYLLERGYQWTDIDQIILTHPHLDHQGLLRRVADLTGAPVYVHEDAVHRVTNHVEEWERAIPFFKMFQEKSGVPADLGAILEHGQRLLRDLNQSVDTVAILKEGDRIPMGNHSWNVISTPGHSSGHLGFYQEEVRHYIAGDHLLQHVSSNAVLEAPLRGSHTRMRSLPVYVQALARIRGMDIERIYPGHGEPFTGHKALIDKRFAAYEGRKHKIQQFLREQPKTVYEIVQHVFPKLSLANTFLAISEIIGHLDLLEDEGKVIMNERDGVWLYHNVSQPSEVTACQG